MTSPKDILSELVIQDLTNKPVQKMADGKSVALPAMKAALKKFSEFLGDIGAEGKTVLGTEADRTKVGGRFLGGPGFSGLQRTSEPHAEVGSVWGVDSPGGVTKMINRNNEPAGGSVWVPFLGSETMHKSNRMVNDSLYRAFLKSVKEGNLTDEMRYRMNAHLASQVDKKDNPIFDPNIDILDPNFRKKHLNTFAQRGAVSDIIGGVGVGKTKAQIIDYDNMLQSMADPLVEGAPTLSVGPRAFTLSGESVYRPDLNKSFPHIVTGEDLGQFQPTPGPLAFPDFTASYAERLNKKGEPSPAGFMDYRAKGPSQFVSEDYLTQLQKAGYADGGSIQHMADGKSVKAFAEKLTHAVSVPFTHFSNSPTLSVLDPAKYGSGIKGAEAARLKFAPEIAPRSYVYSGTKAKPEAGLGPHKYHGVAENVYPLHTDPEGFRDKAQKLNELYPGSFDQQEALNDMERLIKRAGYSGYVNEGGTYPAAVLFQPHPVIPAESLAGHPTLEHAIASKNAEGMLGLRPGNKAEERAAAMGYDARQYHGTNQGEIEAFDPSVKLFSNPAGTFTSPEASFANKYAFERAAHYNPETGMVEKAPGANVMPLMTKSGTAFDPLSPEGQRVLAEYADEMGRSERHKNQMLGGGWEHMEDPDLIDKLKDMGYTGMHVMEDNVKNLATFEPKDLRSVNAAFDPAKAESSDLLHADGGKIKPLMSVMKYEVLLNKAKK